MIDNKDNKKIIERIKNNMGKCPICSGKKNFGKYGTCTACKGKGITAHVKEAIDRLKRDELIKQFQLEIEKYKQALIYCLSYFGDKFDDYFYDEVEELIKAEEVIDCPHCGEHQFYKNIECDICEHNLRDVVATVLNKLENNEKN